MNIIIDGILTRKLPWGFVLIGVFIAIVLKLCGVSPLPFAVGAYLPVSTSTPIFVGGLIRWWVDRKAHAEGMEAEFSPGVLLSSGYIAGGALCGLLVAGLTAKGWDTKIDLSPMMGTLSEANWPACLMFGLLSAVVLWVSLRKEKQ